MLALYFFTRIMFSCCKRPVAVSDDADGQDTPTPTFESYSQLSQFLFLHITPLLLRAAKKGKLKQQDLPPLSKVDEPEKAFREYKLLLKQRRILCCMRPTITAAVIRLRWWKYLYAACLLLVQNAGVIATPMIINGFLDFCASSDRASQAYMGYVWAAGMFAATAAQCLTIHRFWWEASVIGLHSQYALTTHVYTKALQLSSGARARTTRGKLTNHMAIDASRVNDSFIFPASHWFTWSALATIVIGVYQLYLLLGYAGLIGSAALTLFIPLSTVLTRSVKKLSVDIQATRDQRGKLTSEAIAGVVTLKAYAWIDWIAQKIYKTRDNEINLLRKKQYIQVLGDFVGTSAPILMVALMFALRRVFEPGTPLTAAVAFSSVSWVTTIQFPLRTLPYTITTFIDAYVSMSRLKQYINYEDADVGALSEWRDVLCKDSNIIVTLNADTTAEARSAAGAQNVSLNSDNLEAPLLFDKREINIIETTNDIVPMQDWLDGAAGLPPNTSPSSSRDSVRVSVSGAQFGWCGSEEDSPDPTTTQASTAQEFTPAVQSVTFSCFPASLTLIVGPVGCGKSTLLAGLIGEAARGSGRVRVSGSVAYCGQVPWIQNRSVRDNITFGKPFQPTWYAEVLRCCGFVEDVKSMKSGDETLVGDAGITLSGGQKARLALARAVYADADVYVLDDILSAVDAIVAAHIWEACLLGLLVNRGKCVVLATHAVHFAGRRDVSNVLILNALGEQVAFGPVDDAMRHHLEELLAHAPADVDPQAKEKADDISSSSTSDKPTTDDKTAAKASESEEVIASGYVKAAHIWRYVRAFGSNFFLLSLAAMYVIAQGLTVFSTWFLTLWVNNSEANPSPPSESGLTGRSPEFYIYVYSALNGALALVALIRMLCLTLGSLRASELLHNQALAHVLHTSASFFATNPAGRILNRFLSDTSTIDETVRSSLSSLILLVFNLVAVLVVIGLTAPLTLLALLLLSAVYYFLADKYRIAARDLRRLQSVARSPIYSNFTETLRGLAVIRAFGPRVALSAVQHHISLLREYARAWLSYWSANEFISTWLELLGALLILATCMIAVYENQNGSLSAADIGFLLNYILQIPSIFMWLVRYMSQVETDAVAIERVVEYADLRDENTTETLPPPPTNVVADAEDTSTAAISLRDVWLRYDERLPWILKGLNLTIPNAAKVAVVGRTGAGKSTIIQLLLRMYKFDRGVVTLNRGVLNDELCTASRQRSVCALQDGMLFSGTVKENLLGPLVSSAVDDQQLDELVWASLRSVGMHDRVVAMENGLNSQLAELGGNVSAGERALLCLARAQIAMSIKRVNVLLCDEPTAAVDYKSDAAVHDALLSLPSAVLCVCHRLHHIHRFDYVAVIDDGMCVEFGPPQELAARESGYFRSLLQNANLLTNYQSQLSSLK